MLGDNLDQPAAAGRDRSWLVSRTRRSTCYNGGATTDLWSVATRPCPVQVAAAASGFDLWEQAAENALRK